MGTKCYQNANENLNKTVDICGVVNYGHMLDIVLYRNAIIYNKKIMKLTKIVCFI